MTSIGVTGHRRVTDKEAVLQGIDTALNKIQEVFPNPFALYSALAEGADHMVADRALSLLDINLIVPLPLPLTDYLADFSHESQEEFNTILTRADQVVELPLQATREAAYEAAGHYILEHIDVLIAVWDGQPAHGQGGTGQIVSKARQRRLPIAWVSINRGEKKKSDLESNPIRVILERFPS